ncbi:MAG: hypothetical protein KGI25_09775 [Thaumarchaeota archaeon]|nr:hypothetical protein [Nitrososphaerota archaeon]
MNNGAIYLSGGMEKAVENGAQWRREVSKKLEELNFFPVDIAALDLEYIKKHGPVYLDTDPKNYLQYKSNIRHQFIYTDLRLITDDCDAVIAYYDQSFKDGAGSFAECQCAYDHGKPLFVVSALPHVPSWLKSLSTKLFFNFEDLYHYLAKLPDDILKADRYGNHSSQNEYLCSLCGNVFEKSKHHFVSKVSPLLCIKCVDLVQNTREKNADRYQFISEYIAPIKDR